jgi:predicted TIM-barrel fold metal-dependent hydrolase
MIEETQSLLAKPNVYTDISMMCLVAEPARVAQVLRQWLAEWPEKVMFGTDAFDNGPTQSWGMVAWFGAHSAREALTVALTGMMRDGEIDRARAEELARMVLRENAIRAYHLQIH